MGRGPSGRPWRRIRAAVLATSDVCWLCGHPGANDVDHVIPRSLGGDPLDPANLRPAHGADGCPWCRRKCNQARGTRPGLPPLRTSRAW
jgi:5-methylcytosine-specific restriction endonuclease McrA